MPSPSSAAIDARRASRARARAGAPRAGSGSGARAQQRRALAPQVRWDRLARAALLCVLAGLLYLYLSAGVHMFSTWRQAHRDEASGAPLKVANTSGPLRERATPREALNGGTRGAPAADDQGRRAALPGQADPAFFLTR